MAKLKNPVISLEAHGTIADTLTLQRRKGETIARKKPVPRQPNTLAQMYQRWDYQYSISIWHDLSNADKQAYKAAGGRLHMTGFAYWMKVQLAGLPDLVARWHLDEPTGNTAHDSSPYGDPLAITGALHVPARIDYGLYFDGIDDHLYSLIKPQWNITEGTWAAFVYIHSWNTLKSINALITTRGGYSIIIYSTGANTGKVEATANVGAAPNTARSPTAVSLATQLHIGATWDLTTLTLYIGGLPVATANPFPGPLDPGIQLWVASLWLANYNLNATIDEICILSRALTQPQMKLLSERRYPL